jgi:D-amino-acid dehydrogenase
MMPNMMPRVGPGKNDRVFYNTGHGHLGWTLSPATADAIGAAVMARFRSNAPAAAQLQTAAPVLK